MPTISLTLPVSGTVITAGLHSTNYTTIQNVINGGLDTANWAAGKIFAPSKIMQEAATAGQELRWLGATPQWTPDGGYGTSLPASPVDGQQFILVDSTTAPTYRWRFRYNAGSTSAYKWEFVGGTPARVLVGADESTTTSVTWVDLTTVGPSFVVPRAGDYDVGFGADAYCSTGTDQQFIGPAIGAGTPVVNIAFVCSTNQQNIGWSEAPLTGLSASSEIRLRYYQSGAVTAHWTQRRISVLPVRVS